MEEITTVKTAADYMTVLYRVGPLAVIGGTVALFTSLMSILRFRGWSSRFFSIIVSMGVGSIAACIAVLGLPLLPFRPTIELEIVVAALAGSSGLKIFDIYGRKFFGKHLWIESRCEPSARTETDIKKEPPA